MKFFSSFKWNERAWNWILTCLISQCNDTKNGFSQLRHRMKNIKERHNNLQDVFCIRLRIPAFQFLKACYQRKKFVGISWAHSKLALLKDIVMCLSYLAQKKKETAKYYTLGLENFTNFWSIYGSLGKWKFNFPWFAKIYVQKIFHEDKNFFWLICEKLRW